MGTVLLVIGGIGSLICWILVLIQLFKKEGVGLGILGIFCGIYTYIWGWIKSKELGLKNIMLGWTAAIVLSVIGNMMAAKEMLDNPELQEAIRKAQQNQSAPQTP